MIVNIRTLLLRRMTSSTTTAVPGTRSQLPYRLVDIGANLAHPSFAKDLDAVIERAKQAGLVKIMITGTSLASSRQAAVLARTQPDFFYFTAGVHPHDAKDFTASQLDELERLADDAQCVAIGECGLDFNRNFSPQDQQLRVFEQQVQLACRVRKPLFIHEREASSALIEILQRQGNPLPPAVVHCFTGTAQEAKTYIDMGLYIGLTGFLWKDRSKDGVRHALATGVIPLERLLLETDAPFMYPKLTDKRLSAYQSRLSSTALEMNRKFCSFERNEPCALAGICEFIAAIVDCPPETVAEATTRNAINVYGLGEKGS